MYTVSILLIRVLGLLGRDVLYENGSTCYAKNYIQEISLKKPHTKCVVIEY